MMRNQAWWIFDQKPNFARDHGILQDPSIEIPIFFGENLETSHLLTFTCSESTSMDRIFMMVLFSQSLLSLWFWVECFRAIRCHSVRRSRLFDLFYIMWISFSHIHVFSLDFLHPCIFSEQQTSSQTFFAHPFPCFPACAQMISLCGVDLVSFPQWRSLQRVKVDGNPNTQSPPTSPSSLLSAQNSQKMKMKK